MNGTSTTLKTLDSGLVDQLRGSLPANLFEKLSGSLSVDQKQLERLEKENRLLRQLRRLDLLEKYGPAAEALSDAQLELLELEPGVSSAEVQGESQREQLTLPLKRAAKHPGRQELPSNLLRVERMIGCTAQQCVCGMCGQETTVIGYESSEQLDVEPAKYFVRVTKREKRACKDCEEAGVKSAPLPARIIEKGLASDRVVIDTVVSKYMDHLPLYRQSVILERESGIELSRATLDGWVMRVGELSTAIVSAMGQELLRGNYIQADETPIAVQMHDGRGKNHQAYLWQYSSPKGAVIFEFRMGRGRDGPREFLKSFRGILQSDGYAAYHELGAAIVHAGCWAHARRKFFEAVKLSPNDKTSIELVVRINELFGVDAQAREEGLNEELRHALRLAKSKPILQELKKKIEAARAGDYLASVLPGLADFPVNRIAELTPCAWAARI